MRSTFAKSHSFVALKGDRHFLSSIIAGCKEVTTKETRHATNKERLKKIEENNSPVNTNTKSQFETKGYRQNKTSTESPGKEESVLLPSYHQILLFWFLWKHHKRQFAELNIVAWMKADELDKNLWSPNVLAEMFVDLYKVTPQLHRKVLKSSDKHNNGPIAIHKYILWDETSTISLWHSM